MEVNNSVRETELIDDGDGLTVETVTDGKKPVKNKLPGTSLHEIALHEHVYFSSLSTLPSPNCPPCDPTLR